MQARNAPTVTRSDWSTEIAAGKRTTRNHTGQLVRASQYARRAGVTTPETREEKIARLRDEVQRGAYQPDLRQVAERILESGVL
jgi:anti-sigma28 factor (negative regulator of flagellin synthesis)